MRHISSMSPSSAARMTTFIYPQATECLIKTQVYNAVNRNNLPANSCEIKTSFFANTLDEVLTITHGTLKVFIESDIVNCCP